MGQEMVCHFYETYETKSAIWWSQSSVAKILWSTYTTQSSIYVFEILHYSRYVFRGATELAEERKIHYQSYETVQRINYRNNFPLHKKHTNMHDVRSFNPRLNLSEKTKPIPILHLLWVLMEHCILDFARRLSRSPDLEIKFNNYYV